MFDSFEISGRPIGPGHPTYIIAEVSANHGQNIETAKRIIEGAAAAGADAVKLQTYRPDTITLDLHEPPFIVEGGLLWDGASLHDLYADAMTPWEWHQELFDLANSLGMQAFSSPFDPTAVQFLEDLNVPAYKIASFEIIDHGLIELVSRTGKPVIISTGMAALNEIEDAVRVATEAGVQGLALLRCNSGYPAAPEEMDLNTIADMQERFQVPIGLSDHTLGHLASVAGVAMGAAILEKHVTLERSDGGPDAAFSLEQEELAALVSDVREIEALSGSVRYGPSEREVASRSLRRSLFVVEDVIAGEAVTTENVRSIRPGNGMHPGELPNVIGQTFKSDARRGTPLTRELLGPT